MTIVRTRPLLVLIVLVLLSLALISAHQLGYLASTERFVVQFIAFRICAWAWPTWGVFAVKTRNCKLKLSACVHLPSV